MASDGGKTFAPTADLVSVALAIAGLFAGDAWRVRDVETGSELPAVWLRAGNEAAVESALRSIVACVNINGELAATASPEAAKQQLTVWLAECSDARAACTIAWAAGPGPGGGFEALSVAAGALCAVMISRSVMVGVEPDERAGSLERFRPGLSAVLAGSGT